MSVIPSKHLAVGLTSAESGVVSFEVPTPEPGRDEVLVRVQWAAVSFLELWQADFKLMPQYPQILGISTVGEVVKAGEDADVDVGDTIVAFAMLSNQERSFQEYALFSKYHVGKVNISLNELAKIHLLIKCYSVALQYFASGSRHGT